MRLLVTFLMIAGAARTAVPPLAALHRSRSHADAHAHDHLNTPTNWGQLLTNKMDELWEQSTVREGPPPQLIHPNLMGVGRSTTVVGHTMLTIYNRTIYAFKGIRFGKPATGDLRFKKTVPETPYWSDDTLMANHMGDKCPQKAMFSHIGAGNEDCLYLNVFTPYLPDELPDDEPLPVMMFIHGGAFISGDASLYLPTKLLDRDVILVTIHYRLGPFGFFSLDNNDAPGNAGLWDQIEAMKWIQNNINGFGGNPDRVTIFGESAGSASVNFHMILPASRGLFQGVIGESGSALEHWANDPDPVGSAQAFGEFAQCPDTQDLGKLYACMRDMPAKELALYMNEFVSEDRKNGEMGFRGAAPVIQSDAITSERLIVKASEDYYLDGDASNATLMIGANKHEGSFVYGIMYSAFLLPNDYINDEEYLRNDMLDDLLNAFGVSDATHGISESFQDAYLPGIDLADLDAASPGLIDLVGVLFLKAGAWETAKLHDKHTSGTTFFYSFDFHSDDSMFNWLFIGGPEMPFEPGVTHADELMYLFSFPAVMDPDQLPVMNNMVSMWTNFAIYGDPTPQAAPETWLGIPRWLPLIQHDHNYLLIQAECSQEKEYPDRWHIAYEEALPPTNPPPTNPPPTDDPTKNDYDELQKERDAFMISMIVFVVAFVLAGAAASYFFMKGR